MSAEATTWAYRVTVVAESAAAARDVRLGMAAKFLLVTLANYSDQEHSSFPSIDRLAEMMSCSRRTVSGALRELEKWGLVTVEKRRRTNGSQTSSRYYLPVANWAPRSPQSADSAPCELVPEPVDNSASEAPSRVQILHEGGAESAPPLTVTLTRGTNSPVPENVSPEQPVDNFQDGTGRESIGVTPRALSKTHGLPLQPADVFASVGHQLPDHLDDTGLETLAAEILGRSASRVLDPTGYVIRTLRLGRYPTAAELVDKGAWLVRAEVIADMQAAARGIRVDGTHTGARF